MKAGQFGRPFSLQARGACKTATRADEGQDSIWRTPCDVLPVCGRRSSKLVVVASLLSSRVSALQLKQKSGIRVTYPRELWISPARVDRSAKTRSPALMQIDQTTLQALAAFPRVLEAHYALIPKSRKAWAPRSWDGVPSEPLTAIEQLCHVRDIEIEAEALARRDGYGAVTLRSPRALSLQP